MKTEDEKRFDVRTFDRSLKDRVLTVKGKGGRERLVPLNDAAQKALVSHLAALDAEEVKGKAASPWLFPSGNGSQHLTRQRLGQELKALALRVGLSVALFLFLMAGYYFGLIPGKL